MLEVHDLDHDGLFSYHEFVRQAFLAKAVRENVGLWGGCHQVALFIRMGGGVWVEAEMCTDIRKTFALDGLIIPNADMSMLGKDFLQYEIAGNKQ